MRTRMWRRIATPLAAGLSTLALLVVTAGAAMANPVTRLNDRAISVGRGGVIHLQPQSGVSTSSMIVAIGISLLIVAVVAGVFLALDRRTPQVRLAAVPDRPAGQSMEEEPAGERGQERKAA